MSTNIKYYIFIAILILWHIFMLVCYTSPNVSDIYYQYYIKGGIEKWNRGKGSRYSYGKLIDFRKGGDSEDFVLGGFSNQEKLGSWTSGENIHIFLLPDSLAKHDINLYLGAFPFINKKHKSQIIEVSVNGIMVKKYKYSIINSERSLQIIRINKNIINSKNKNIDIKINAFNLVSPRELGLNDDARKLGLCVDSIMLKEIKR